MANMQYMQAQARSANTRFVESLGNKAINEINRQYGEAVDEMFHRLHKQSDGFDFRNLSEEEARQHNAEIGYGYTRVGFKSKADRDRFVTDMTSNGIEATYATEKVGGQWLVEIPNAVKAESLKGELKEIVEESGRSSSDRVSAQAILKNFTERTHVPVSDPTPVEIRQEADVGTVQTNAHQHLTKHLDELGTVINKSVNFAKQLDAYTQDNDAVFKTGNVKAGNTKTAVVLNGSTVIIGGQVVTDEAVRSKVLKEHERRMRRVDRVKVGDFIVKKTDRINEIRADKTAKKNTEVTQRKNPFVKHSYADEMRKGLHPVLSKIPLTGGIMSAYDLVSDKGLGKEVFEADMYSPQAKTEVKNMLIDGGFDTERPEIVYKKNGDVFGATYLNDEGKRITIVHKHREAKEIKPPLSKVYSNKKAIQAAAYKQEYALAGAAGAIGSVKVAETFKDMKLSKSSVDVMNKFFTSDAKSVDKLSVEQIKALISFSETGTANNLSLRQREDLAKQLQEQADAIKWSLKNQAFGLESNYTAEEYAALNQAIDEIKLSEQEKVQEQKTDKNGNIVKDLIKIDFGLAEIEAVAEGFNLDWQIVNATDTFNFGTPTVNFGNEDCPCSLFADMRRNGSELDVSQYKVLKKVQENPKVKLTTEERYHLSKALNDYEKHKGKELTEDDKKVIKDIKEKIQLNDSEIESVERMTSIERDLGIKTTSANFSPDKVMKMNEAFIDKANASGINIFAKDGKSISVEKLEMIRANPELMKRMDVSKETLDAMIKVNKAQITNPHLYSGLNHKVISLVCRADESGSISEVYNAGNKIYTGVKYTKSGIVAIRNNAEALSKRKQKKKADKSGYGKGKSEPKKRKEKKAPKRDKEEKLLYNASPEKLEKMGAKTKKTQNKGLNKAARREKSIAGRYMKTKEKVMSKLANSALGKLLTGVKSAATKFLIKPLAIAGGVILCAEAVIIIIMIVLMTIAAFLDAINPINIINNALAPETYADTVAYTLYEDYLVVKERDWLEDDLQNFDKMYAERVDMRYGSDYEDFDTYMSRFDDVVLKDEDGNGYASNIWINPFASSGVSHDGIIHEGYSGHRNTGKYDGTQTVTIGANNNVFGLALDKDSSSARSAYTTIESGHTCNIKDILCMTDVMYGHNLTEIGLLKDGEYQSLLGASPEQVSFQDGVENVKGFFKWLWNTIKSINPFSETRYEPLKKFCNDKVGMKTIIKYAETLYESSHQQEVSLTVEYHSTDALVVQTSGGAVDITNTTGQREASLLGYCTSPVTTKFYLKWNTSDTHGYRVSPYFTQYEDGTGNQYVVDLPTSETGYKVQIDMSQLKNGEDDACLKSDMSSNSATYDYIKAMVASPLKLCWKQTKNAEVQDPVTKAYCTSASGGTGYYTRSGDNFTWHEGSGGWYDSESAAKSAVEDDLRAKYDSASLHSDTYVLAGDRNKFTKTFEEQPAFSVNYDATTTESRITGYHSEDYTVEYYWTSASHEYLSHSDCGYGGDWCVRKWDNESTPAESGGQPVWYATGFGSEDEAQTWVDEHSSEITTGWYSLCIKFENRTRIVSEEATFYHSSGNCVTVEKKIDEFIRECKGHDFQYCGGHIGMHSHGIVYSFSNEQIALSTVRDETNGNPLADGFDLAANGYEELRGKIIADEVNYGNVVDAASSGGCKSPWIDPQGSISGMYGLNLKTSGSEWASGYGTRVGDGMHLMRDIFDIDTNVLKGDNIFPLSCDYKNYEGWTEDNMTLAILKWAADWYEEYGFDIPQEIWYGDLGTENDDGTITPYDYGYKDIGQAALSTEDIENIVTALKDKYGSTFDEEREEAVRLALGFVGKGHYSKQHSHDFLSEACNGLTVWVRDSAGNEGTVTYSGCCTAGDEDDFTNYLREHFGKTKLTSESSYPIAYTFSSGCNAYPADIVAHKATDVMSVTIPKEKSHYITKKTLKRLSEISKFKTAMFIGVLNNDIELSTGQVLKAGAPIVVDLTTFSTDKVDGIGNVYLHGRKGDGDFDAVSFDCYEWLYNDTSKTRIARFN